MPRSIVTLSLSAVLVMGCASQQEIEAQRAYQREQYQAARLARMEARCQQLGFAPGAPDFRQCMLALEQSSRQGTAAQDAVILQHLLNQQRR